MCCVSTCQKVKQTGRQEHHACYVDGVQRGRWWNLPDHAWIHEWIKPSFSTRKHISIQGFPRSKKVPVTPNMKNSQWWRITQDGTSLQALLLTACHSLSLHEDRDVVPNLSPRCTDLSLAPFADVLCQGFPLSVMNVNVKPFKNNETIQLIQEHLCQTHLIEHQEDVRYDTEDLRRFVELQAQAFRSWCFVQDDWDGNSPNIDFKRLHASTECSYIAFTHKWIAWYVQRLSDKPCMYQFLYDVYCYIAIVWSLKASQDVGCILEAHTDIGWRYRRQCRMLRCNYPLE